MSIFKSSAVIAASLSVLLSSVAFGADLAVVDPMFKPAVDAINGKLDGFGGWTDGRNGRDDKFSGGAVGSLSVPIGERFGFQADGLLSSSSSDLTYGAAGHFFTRNPDSYLLGAYVSGTGFENRGGAWVGKVGAEAEVYLGDFTVSGIAGWEHVHGGSNSRFVVRGKDRFFDAVDLSYYPTDDFKLSVGHRYIVGKHAGALGAEYQLPIDALNVALFGEGRLGEKSYKSALGGVRVYFGAGDKTLKARQRESDPSTWLDDDLSSNIARRAKSAEPGQPDDGCVGAGLVQCPQTF